MFKIKGLFEYKKWFQWLKPIYVAYPYPQGPHCKELIAKSLFSVMGENFPTFPAGNQFCD
jgi:hypothetical protein